MMENFKFYPKYPAIFFNTNKTIVTIEYSESIFGMNSIYIFL